VGEKRLCQCVNQLTWNTLYCIELIFPDDENAESMMKMFVGLPAEIITHSVSKIHEELSKFIFAEYFEETLGEKDSPLAPLHGIQKCFIIFQNRCVQATEELSRLVNETASQHPEGSLDAGACI
jgi:hypothetical protein